MLLIVHRLYTVADGPNPDLISPWRGPFTVRSQQLSPVIYRVATDGEHAETSLRLGRIKAYQNDASSSVPDFTALDDLFLGTLPVPHLDGSVLTVHIGPYTIEAIEGHKRGPGKASLTNFQYHVLVKYTPSNLGIWRHVNVVPQCYEMIRALRAYCSRISAEDPHAFDPPKSTKSKRDVVAQSF